MNKMAVILIIQDFYVEQHGDASPANDIYIDVRQLKYLALLF